MMDLVVKYFLLTCMTVMAVLFLLCLYRCIRGPRFTDRMVMGNALSTMVVVFIALLAVYLKESYLLDVGAIYAMLGFLSVAVLCRIAAFRVYGKKLHEAEEGEGKANDHDF